MKMLVETSGQFQLQDMNVNPLISAHRPTVVENTNFVQHRVALDQIKILGKLKDEATNEDFMGYMKDSEDVALAVASFMSAFGLEEFPDEPVNVDPDPNPEDFPPSAEEVEPETKKEKKARLKAEAEEAALSQADAEMVDA